MKNFNSSRRQEIHDYLITMQLGDTRAAPLDSVQGRVAQSVVQDHNGQQVAKWAKYSDRRFRSFKDSGYVWIVRTR